MFEKPRKPPKGALAVFSQPGKAIITHDFDVILAKFCDGL